MMARSTVAQPQRGDVDGHGLAMLAPPAPPFHGNDVEACLVRQSFEVGRRVREAIRRQQRETPVRQREYGRKLAAHKPVPQPRSFVTSAPRGRQRWIAASMWDGVW